MPKSPICDAESVDEAAALAAVVVAAAEVACTIKLSAGGVCGDEAIVRQRCLQ